MTTSLPIAPGAIPALSMGRVVLTVNDLDLVARFYRNVLGFEALRSDGTVAELGAGGDVLLELRQDRAARRATPREAGLFHTAFLLPERADLARWVKHAAAARAPVVGASDHLVSEAIYLSDPEGNGVEIYADRPPQAWTWDAGTVHMATEPLDVDDLVQAAGSSSWRGAPEGTRVGHVHLKVGALPPAEDFYAGLLGFGITSRYPGGTFYALDHYHHHLATNVWNSRGAGVRAFPSTGLAAFEIALDADRLAAIAARAGQEAADTLELTDPWGTAVRIVTAGAART
ncbi:VOC family protein [Aquabacter sediminis]|uniref:VOC family protein n=1 Tax=Aquabacter sediminis TaxID=3029197 RepID=UPI00237E2D96|nr:VOC family protein [Aquabacter sp. P-9]MDE1566584.1 VOC family protein [Aquabacter sp. P-9]